MKRVIISMVVLASVTLGAQGRGGRGGEGQIQGIAPGQPPGHRGQPTRPDPAQHSAPHDRQP